MPKKDLPVTRLCREQKSTRGSQVISGLLCIFMISFAVLSVFALTVFSSGTVFGVQEGDDKDLTELTHEMTPKERAMMPAYLEAQKLRAVTSPPTGVIRSIAEFEPMEGVLIAYPLGIPVALVAEMSEDVTVTTIVNNQSQENQVRSTYSSNGVNMSNCNFIHVPHDSYWTRDYGPWFIMESTSKISIVDFTYNRPRPNDNSIPSEMSSFLNVDLYGMNLTHCGGNYMTGGLGIAASTDLVWDENSSQSHAQINQTMTNFLGIQTYHVKEDPLGDYIKHIDCWGKYLATDKIIIAKVPTSNSNYSKYEQTVTYFQGQTSGYGNNYKVYRVDSPNGQPYTNSIIINNKVLVPITSSSGDSAAISAYQAAMPGYEVLGFTGSWDTTDAIHCRVKGIADRGMLYIKHMPTLGSQNQQNDFEITAQVVPFSGQALTSGYPKVFYRVDGGAFTSVNMTATGGSNYTASIPGQSSGSAVAYYIEAKDQSGRTGRHPFIGSPDPHVFNIVSGTGAPTAQFTASPTSVNVGGTVQFTDQSTNSPTAWSWTFTGGTPASSTSQNPTVTYNTAGTYAVALTVTNAAGSDSETKSGYITVSSGVPAYCSAGGNNSSYEWISRVQIGSFDNSSGAAGYTDFTTQTVSLTAGSSTAVTLTPGFSSSSYNEYWKIWIDLNKDGDFDDSGEELFSGSGTSAVTGSLTAPSSASGITTMMRVTMRYNTAPNPCGSFDYGEVEDYKVTITGGSTTNPPVAAFTASATTIQKGQSVTFTDQSTNSPTTWDWTFSGGTPGSSTAQNPAVTYDTPGTYTVTLRVSNADGSDTETKTNYITVNDTVISYCSPQGNNYSYEWLARVQVGNLDNSSNASGYSDFTSQTANLTAGASVNVTLTPGFSGSSYTEYYKIWVDWNKDGDFDDAGEEVFSQSGTAAVSGSFTVPASASGSMRMRIIMKYNAAPTPCETFDYGEVEDYTVSIN